MLDGSLEWALQIFIAYHRCSGAALRVRTLKAKQATGQEPKKWDLSLEGLTIVEEEMR